MEINLSPKAMMQIEAISLDTSRKVTAIAAGIIEDYLQDYFDNVEKELAAKRVVH